MRRLLFVALLCFSSVLLASFEDQEKVLAEWLVNNPADEGQETIRVQTEEAGKVSNHRYDDVDWSTKCLQGLSCWIGGGSNPVPGAIVTVAAGVATAGVWPACVLATAGVAHAAEKIAVKLDVRKQEAEHQTFTSQRNQDRYIAARLVLLIGGFRASHAPLGSEESHAVYTLYNEWATSVGLPLPEEEKSSVVVDTLALRINKEIHKHKPAQLQCLPGPQG